MKNEDIKLNLRFLEDDLVARCMEEMDTKVFKKDPVDEKVNDHGRNLYQMGVRHGVMRALQKFNDKSLLIPMIILSDEEWKTIENVIMRMVYLKDQGEENK